VRTTLLIVGQRSVLSENDIWGPGAQFAIKLKGKQAEQTICLNKGLCGYIHLYFFRFLTLTLIMKYGYCCTQTSCGPNQALDSKYWITVIFAYDNNCGRSFYDTVAGGS